MTLLRAAVLQLMLSSVLVLSKRQLFLELAQLRSRVAALENGVSMYTDLAQYYSTLRNLLVEAPEGLSETVSNRVPWNTNVSQACVNDVTLIINAARNQSIWAIQYADAAGKPESGVMQGNFGWLGSFGQCMAIAAVTNNDTNVDFRGKYCLAEMGPHRNASDPQMQFAGGPAPVLALRVAICFPDSCTDEDTLQVFTNLLSIVPPNPIMTLEVYGSTCQPRTREFDTKAIAVLSLISFFAFLIVIGTLYDVAVYQPLLRDKSNGVKSTKVTSTSIYPPIGTQTNGHVETGSNNVEEDDAPLLTKEVVTEKVIYVGDSDKEIGFFLDFVLAFSAYTNGQKLLSTSQPSKAITCIHGIRFISMTWIILAHTYGFQLQTVRDIITIPGVLGGIWFQVIANASIAVDTFFAMSGLLMCYLFVLGFKKTAKFPVLQFYLHRYWRLTAVYAFIMGVYLALFAYISNGPNWAPGGMEQNFCRRTWWLNLLYINNLVRTKEECMGWTWYLANDMQFYWISPLILLPLVKFPKIGVGILAIFFSAHIVVTAVLSAYYDFIPSMTGDGTSGDFVSKFWPYYDMYYIKPWTRIGPYLVGMFFGYLLAKYSKEKVKIPTALAGLLWIVATVSATTVLYGLWEVNKGHPLSTAEATIYNTLHRNVWALSVCWVIFACVQGYGGFVNTLLSWKAFVPLSRLTYCAYLIHIPLLLVFYLSRTTTRDFSHLETVYYFFGTLMTTYGFAFLLATGVESPLLTVEKVIEKHIKKSQAKKKY